MTRQRVIIIGGGLAGLSCAIELLECGITPIVLEAKPFVGGRTASWDADGMRVESGLHRYLGFYSHLPRLIRKAGLKLTDIIFWENAIEMRHPESSAVYHASIHRPFRTLRSFVGNTHYLNWRDKLQLVRLFAAGAKDYVLHRSRLIHTSVDEYATQHGVTQQAHDRALIPGTEGIFFVKPDRYATYNLMGLVMPYVLRLWKFRVGGFRGGMTEVMAEPLARAVRERGGEVQTNTAVKKLVMTDGRVTGVECRDGTKLTADWVVLASSVATAQELTRPLETPWRDNFQKLETVPVVTVHLELKRPAMPLDRTTFGPTTMLAAFAEQSRTTFSASRGRLSIILSPPEEFMDTPEKQLIARILAELAAIGITLQESDVVDMRKVVLPMDFYSLRVGQEDLRPPQDSGITGLTLAGDYTKQRYLGTMEGAVYSGKCAAEMVKKYLS